MVSGIVDGMLLYATALQETLDAKEDVTVGRNVQKRLWNRTFEGSVYIYIPICVLYLIQHFWNRQLEGKLIKIGVYAHQLYMHIFPYIHMISSLVFILRFLNTIQLEYKMHANQPTLQ